MGNTEKPSSVSVNTAIIAIALGCSLIGCQSASRHWSADEGRAYTTPKKTSLTFDSPRLQRLEASRDRSSDTLSWYAARNDALLTVEGGYQGMTLDNSYSYTYDRQYHNGSYVRDYYSSTTHRRSYSTGSR